MYAQSLLQVYCIGLCLQCALQRTAPHCSCSALRSGWLPRLTPPNNVFKNLMQIKDNLLLFQRDFYEKEFVTYCFLPECHKFQVLQSVRITSIVTFVVIIWSPRKVLSTKPPQLVTFIFGVQSLALGTVQIYEILYCFDTR